MSRVQQLWTMTVQSYLSQLKREISRNKISFSHPRIPLWAVNMKNTQGAVLEHVIINAPLAWAGERTFLMPPHPILSLFFSQNCIQIDSLQRACFLLVKRQRGCPASVQAWEMYHSTAWLLKSQVSLSLPTYNQVRPSSRSLVVGLKLQGEPWHEGATVKEKE